MACPLNRKQMYKKTARPDQRLPGPAFLSKLYTRQAMRQGFAQILDEPFTDFSRK